MSQQYAWIPFYEELANKLLPYKEDRQALIDKIQGIFATTGLKMPTLDSHPVPIDIDPFSVYALFNKHITLENRIKLVATFKDSFSVDTPAPREFNGVPLVNNLVATFYAFDGAPQFSCHFLCVRWCSSEEP